MKQSWFKLLFGLILAATLSAPAWGANPAQLGTINYVEGQAFINSQPLGTNSVGSAELLTGQTISTRNGRVEVLLTPGVFLRIDDNSSAILASARLTDTDVRLINGRATVEVDELHHQNNLRLEVGNATTTLIKPGFYSFDADHGQIQVLKGEALVARGGQQIKLGKNRSFSLANPNGDTGKLDENVYEQDDFYQWSSLRSEYLSEANADAGQSYTLGYWPGTGWYWDPYFASYTFIPGDGVFYSPFGYGYYSPFVVFESPFFFGGGRFFHHFDEFRGRGAFFGGGFHGREPLFHGEFHGVRGDEFHGNPGFRSGGGFHGGSGFHDGGGFHNSGGLHGGGGFHDGGGFHGGGGGFHGGGGHGR